MKKIFSIFTVLMLVIMPFCFSGCGNNSTAQIEYNVIKDWTDVQKFSICTESSYTKLSQSSTIYFKYTEEECTEEEYNNSQNKYVISSLAVENNKQTSIKQAQERLNNRIYYSRHYISQDNYTYHKYTYNGFYTDIIQIKIYSNNYLEYKHVYEDYGTVNEQHPNHVEGIIKIDSHQITITYFE